VGFLFDYDGTFTGTGRVVQWYTFGPDFQTLVADGYEDIFPPDQDPTDPDAVPSDHFEYEAYTMVRLNFMD
jgi:hypothetical protein